MLLLCRASSTQRRSAGDYRSAALFLFDGLDGFAQFSSCRRGHIGDLSLNDRKLLFAGPIVMSAARGKLPLRQRPEAPL